MRFLLDENLEHEVYHRLDSYGHDVRHVDLSDELGKGDPDPALARFSREGRRVIVTYDDDFRTDVPEAAYHAVLYLPDQTRSATEVADALHEVSKYYGTDDLTGFRTVGRDWL
jgi:hypothetical protein